jgi:hypothetical protein
MKHKFVKFKYLNVSYVLVAYSSDGDSYEILCCKHRYGSCSNCIFGLNSAYTNSTCEFYESCNPTSICHDGSLLLVAEVFSDLSIKSEHTLSDQFKELVMDSYNILLTKLIKDNNNRITISIDTIDNILKSEFCDDMCPYNDINCIDNCIKDRIINKLKSQLE